MFADYHVHSDYSDDSFYLMEDVVLDAIELQLDEICFTEHVDYGVKEDWKADEPYIVGGNKLIRNVNYERYFNEVETLKQKYKKDINIKVGLEFGIQMITIPQFMKLYKTYNYDFILLSIHQVDNEEFWTGDFERNRTEKECYAKYYQELYDVICEYKDYSCLAHMDLIRRYLDPTQDTFEDHKEIIEKILRKVIEDGKGIEVNTSSKRYGIDGLTPSIEILKLYHSLGGKIITVGSDSHKKEHLACDIKESLVILKEIGFEYFYTFDKMEPVFHKI